MRKIKELQKVDQSTIVAENCVGLKAGKNLKRVIYLASLVGLGLFLNSCSTGYVSTTPTYVQGIRPANPGNGYIWVNDDWAYNRQSKVYVQNNGNWQKQRPRKTFVPGHWEATPRGNYWVASRWQRVGR